MTTAELLERVARLRRAGTDLAHIEAKRAATDLPKGIRKTLSALSNTTGGGVVILGLDEGAGFEATGVRDAKRLAATLGDVCRTEMDPPVRAFVGIHELEGQLVVVAEVPELDPSRKPGFYRAAGMLNGSYLRVGDGNYRLSPYEIQMMVAARGQPREDLAPVPEARPEALDRGQVSRLLERVRAARPRAFSDVSDTDALRRLRVLVDGPSGGAPVPSVAGLLALGVYPQEFFPQLDATFVSYPTPEGVASATAATGVRFLDNQVLEGPIPGMLSDALAVVRKNMRRRSVVVAAGRVDVWEYPEIAIREAVANALVHRDLSPASRGSQVQIEMYPDRLEVRNPGGLFGPVQVTQLGAEGVTSSRNAALHKLLEDVAAPGEDGTVCENRGSGIRTMVAALQAAGMSPPRFDTSWARFVVVFPNHALLGAQSVPEQLAIETPTSAEAAPASATRRRGPRRADRSHAILSAIGTGERTRAEIARLTGLTDKTVLWWLRKLRNNGLVEETTEKVRSRHVRYRRAP